MITTGGTIACRQTAEGLSPVRKGPAALQAAADIRAQEAVESFSHTRPNGESWSTVLDEEGVVYFYAGENLASGFSSAVAVKANADTTEKSARSKTKMNDIFLKILFIAFSCFQKNIFNVLNSLLFRLLA